jgi:hypothetical protein
MTDALAPRPARTSDVGALVGLLAVLEGELLGEYDAEPAPAPVR